MCVRVLGTEHRANLEYATKVSRDSLLLSELGTLSKECPTTEVVYGEYSSTTLGGGRLQLRGVDLNEALLLEGVSKDSRDHGTNTEESLVGGMSKIEDTGVHTVAKSLRGLVVAER
jgi:hypothetical protein